MDPRAPGRRRGRPPRRRSDGGVRDARLRWRRRSGRPARPGARPARGLAYSETAPMMGAPMGVLPRNAIVQSAITRPRKGGSLVSWSVVLPVARKVMLAAPTSAMATSATGEGRRGRGAQDGDAEGRGGHGQGAEPGAPVAGHHEPAHDRAGAHGGGEQAVGLRPAPERAAGQQRQHDAELVGEGADEREHHQRHQEVRRAAHVAQALAHLARPRAAPGPTGAARTGPSRRAPRARPRRSRR